MEEVSDANVNGESVKSARRPSLKRSGSKKASPRSSVKTSDSGSNISDSNIKDSQSEVKQSESPPGLQRSPSSSSELQKSPSESTLKVPKLDVELIDNKASAKIVEPKKDSKKDEEELAFKVTSIRKHYESLVQDLQDRLSHEEEAHTQLSQTKKKLENEISSQKKEIEDMELALQKVITWLINVINNQL